MSYTTGESSQGGRQQNVMMESSTQDSSPTRIANRYRIVKKLGAGGMGVVYLVRDDLMDQVVALKQVLVPRDQLRLDSDSTESDIYLTLAREFRTLANLRHPNVVQVRDFGFDEQGFPFFTMDYLPDAQPLTDAGLHKPKFDQIHLLGQTLQALEYLHRRRILHRDIKPDNVLVDADFQVKVLDFGLALERISSGPNEYEDQMAGGVVGTLAYMAPELMAGETYSVQSDLYAVGTMGYELFVGRHPFNTGSIGSMMIAIMTQGADLSDLDDDTTEWIEALLDKDPDNRPESAYRALNALYELFQLDAPVESVEVRESFLQSSRFVGRKTELAKLTDSLGHLVETSLPIRERHSRWLVGGESGVGKSRLIEEVRTRAMVKGIRVLRGQAVEGGGVSYQVWRDILRPLVLSTSLSDLEAGVLREVVPDVDRLLGRSVPDIAPLNGDAHGERLSITVVDVIKRQQTPLLLILEDIQWAEEGQRPLKLLLRLLDQIDTPVMVLATFRTDEAHKLGDEFPELERIILKRLDRDTLRKLVESMVGRDNVSEKLLDALEAETEGNVYFTVEVVRALAEAAGSLNQIRAEGLPERIMAGGILAVLRRRLDSMPDAYREMLRLVAVLGRELDTTLLQAAEPSINIEDFITAGANRAVFEFIDTQWRFAHDKLRETLLNGLNPDERVRLHRKAAEAIEATYPDDVAYAETLVNLWRKADDPAKTVHYSMIAAENMIDLTAEYDKASQFIDDALELSVGLLGAPTLQARLHTLSGNLYFRRGNYRAAKAAYRKSLAQTDNENVGYDIETRYRLAQTLTFTGDYDEAEALALQILSEADTSNKLAESFARMSLGVIADARGEYTRALEEKTRAIGAAKSAGDRRLEAIWLANVAIAHGRMGNLEATERLFKQALVTHRDVGNRREEAQTLNNLGFTAHVKGDLDGAEWHYSDSLRIYEAIGSDGRSEVLNNLGIVTTDRGDYSAAIQYFAEGLDVLRNTERRDLLIEVLNSQTNAFLLSGDTESAVTNLKECLSVLRNLDSRRLILMTLMQLAHLRLRRAQHETALQLVGFIEGQTEADPQFTEMHLYPVKASLIAHVGPEEAAQWIEVGGNLRFNDVMMDLEVELKTDAS